MNIRNICEMIAGYYNGQSDYEKNGKFSDRYTTVYTSPLDKGWLSVENKGGTAVEVRLTDNEGFITARDNYSVVGGEAVIKSAERQVKDGTAMVFFLPEELSILQSFGEECSKDTTDHLRIIAPLIKDEQARNIALRTADKIDMLSEATYTELFRTTNRRYEMKQELSIRQKLTKAREKAAIQNRDSHSKAKWKGARSL